MPALLTLLFGLLGLFVGSFLNVCIDRLPRSQSIISPPSHCPDCNRKLTVADLVPVFSYLWLKGRCRYCHARIPSRLPVVEGITAFIFAFLYQRYGLNAELAILLYYSALMIVIFVIDLENQLILNKITYPAMLIAIVLAFARPQLREVGFFGDVAIIRAVSFLDGNIAAQMALALAGGLLGLVVMSIPIIIYPAGMAWGDVKLAALIGLMTGYPLVVVALLISWIIGGIVAALLLALKMKGRKDPIPSGTFLAAAALITLVWGKQILTWYL